VGVGEETRGAIVLKTLWNLRRRKSVFTLKPNATTIPVIAGVGFLVRFFVWLSHGPFVCNDAFGFDHDMGR
jgi:hypothetical protein